MSDNETRGSEHPPVELEFVKIDENCPWCGSWGNHECPGPPDNKDTGSGS